MAKKSASAINIKKSTKGSFTKLATAHHQTVQQYASTVLNAPKGTFSPGIVAKANFARNFGGGKAGGNH